MKIAVNAEALRRVLLALFGPGHYIRELQVTRDLDEVLGTHKNPINILANEYNEWVKTVTYKELAGTPAVLAGWVKYENGTLPHFVPAIAGNTTSPGEGYIALFDAPIMPPGNAEIMDSYQSMQEELKWVKDVIAEHIGYDGPLGPAMCPLVEVLTKAEKDSNQLAVQDEKILSLESKIVQLTAQLDTVLSTPPDSPVSGGAVL